MLGLSLPDGLPTGHITWDSRGYYEPEEGFTPVTAPGPLAGLPYSAAFRRVGDAQFAIRGILLDEAREDNHCDTVWHALQSLGPKYEKRGGMFNSASHEMRLLDGGLDYYAADYGFSGSPRLTLHGNRALRLICHRLGLRQPRRFRDEASVPTLAELEAELLDQLRHGDNTSGEPEPERPGPTVTPKRRKRHSKPEVVEVVVTPIEQGWAALSRTSWNYINDQLDQIAAIASCSTWREYRALGPTDFDEMVVEITGVEPDAAVEESEPFEVDLSVYEGFDRDFWLMRGTMDLFESIGNEAFPWDMVVCLDTAGFVEAEHRDAFVESLIKLGYTVTIEER